ncbi:uncharacterized protein LOC143215519 [Lasioglossum baleicum]|uniref:uncharacterized protein LOC143215519 n=1 Tax=Lasioglossum baleicum TaxID=434251 RepID=UPI003FCD1E83
MNTDVVHDKSSRYEKLAKPKKRVDRNVNQNPYHIKAGALSYQITDSLNRLANPKRRTEAHEPVDSRLPFKTAPVAAVRYGTHRLINSDEQSKDAQETKKKKFLIDTYARIVAARNKRTSKRLQDLAKPKNYSARAEPGEEFDDYLQNMNKCNVKTVPRRAR